MRVRGQWVLLDAHEVEQALSFFERHGAGGALGLAEALSLALSPPDPGAAAGRPPPAGEGSPALPVIVDAGPDIQHLLDDLTSGHSAAPAAPEASRSGAEPPGFVGRLRPYQRRGVAWLGALRRHGLGACLADDMGLGKTPTMIALLLAGRRPAGADDPPAGAGPALVVCPTSVVGNWQRELARFGPGLRVLVHHGPGRARERLAGPGPRARRRPQHLRLAAPGRGLAAGGGLGRGGAGRGAEHQERLHPRGADRQASLRPLAGGPHRDAGGEPPERPVEHLPVPQSRLPGLGRDLPQALRRAHRARHRSRRPPSA